MRPALPDGPWLVVGLARSGVGAGRLLRARGEHVIGVDTGTPDLDVPFETRLGSDGTELLDSVNAIVKSPGVPPRAPVIAAARARGIPVLGELELAWRLLADNRFVAVTGTNGKTTTTEWLAHVWRTAGLPVATAGNVGTALSSLPGTLEPGTTVVCECSSYQLFDTLAFRPEVGVLLDVGSDHLDWHGSAEAYREAKLTGMFSRQTAEDIAVVPATIDVPGDARRVEWTDEPVGKLGLPGEHNVLNARAVAAAARASGVPEDALAAGLADFGGVEHRLEGVAVIDGVRWVNDSKATNVASTLVALRAFGTSPIRLILGGDDAKGEDFEPLRSSVAEHCASVHLIGEAGPRLQHAIGTGSLDSDLEHAVAAAGALARPGDVVLLSPACSSFDQFKDFEERGRRFKELVVTRRS